MRISFTLYNVDLKQVNEYQFQQKDKTNGRFSRKRLYLAQLFLLEKLTIDNWNVNRKFRFCLSL